MLCAQHLVAVHGVGELVQQRGQPAGGRPGLAERALPGVAGRRRGVALRGGRGQRRGDPLARGLTGRGDQRRDRRRRAPGPRGRPRPGPGPAVPPAACRRSDSARPAIARARSSAVRSASRASTSADRAAASASAAASRTSVSGSSSTGSSSATASCCSAASSASSASDRRASTASRRSRSRCASAAADRDGLLQPAELGGRRGPALLGRALLLLGGGQVGQPGGLLGPGAVQRRPQPGQLPLDAVPGGGRASSTAACTSSGPTPPRTRRGPGPRPAGRPAR